MLCFFRAKAKLALRGTENRLLFFSLWQAPLSGGILISVRTNGNCFQLRFSNFSMTAGTSL